jgi:hypothetical protein
MLGRWRPVGVGLVTGHQADVGDARILQSLDRVLSFAATVEERSQCAFGVAAGKAGGAVIVGACHGFLLRVHMVSERTEKVKVPGSGYAAPHEVIVE